MSHNQKNTFDFHGLPVRYYKTGEGPPLLLLHGWGSSASVMLPLSKALSDIRTCYIPDLPGFGDTPPPDRAWSVDDYVDLAVDFVSKTTDGPVDVIAHSFGGRMVLKWAAGKHEPNEKDLRAKNAETAEQADLLEKIIITGGAGMKPRRTFSFYRRRIQATILKAPFFLLPGALKNKALTWLRNTPVWKSMGSSDYRKLDGVMRETFVRTVSEHLEPCLPEISHEILLIWGKEDPATPWYQAERMEKGLRHGALVGIDHAGHYAFLDQPAHFVRIVRAYFEQEGANH